MHDSSCISFSQIQHTSHRAQFTIRREWQITLSVLSSSFVGEEMTISRILIEMLTLNHITYSSNPSSLSYHAFIFFTSRLNYEMSEWKSGRNKLSIMRNFTHIIESWLILNGKNIDSYEVAHFIQCGNWKFLCTNIGGNRAKTQGWNDESSLIFYRLRAADVWVKGEGMFNVHHKMSRGKKSFKRNSIYQQFSSSFSMRIIESSMTCWREFH